MSRPIEDQRILITGGCENFGFELANWLDERGARVAVTGKDADERDRGKKKFAERGAEVAVYRGDVTSPDDLDWLADELEREFGGLDALFNNASIFTSEPLEELDQGKIEAAVQVGVQGALNATKSMLPLLRAVECSRIVNLVGWSGLPGKASNAVYSTVKGGLRTFGEGVREELTDGPVEVTNLVLGSMGSWLGFDPADEEMAEQDWPMLKVSEVVEAVEFILTRTERVSVDEIRLRNRREQL